ARLSHRTSRSCTCTAPVVDVPVALLPLRPKMRTLAQQATLDRERAKYDRKYDNPIRFTSIVGTRTVLRFAVSTESMWSRRHYDYPEGLPQWHGGNTRRRHAAQGLRAWRGAGCGVLPALPHGTSR